MRLIDAYALESKICRACNGEFPDAPCGPSECRIVRAIRNAPFIEKNPVRHGYWYLLDECSNAGVYCSVCNKKVYKESYANQKLKSPYCPNCGAKMD